MIFAVLFATITAVYVLEPLQGSSATEEKVRLGWWIIAWAIAMGAIVLVLDLLTPNKRITAVSGIFFGLVAGLLATWALSLVIDLLIQAYDVQAPSLVTALKVLMGIALSYLGISVVLQTQDDFRLVIPYVEFTKQYRGSTPILLDTSALIDGRIYDVAQTGFIQVPVVVPQFVIRELQTLSDSADKLKRTRGRRGLEIIGKLQRTGGLDLTIDPSGGLGTGVDQQLVELAVQMPASILTADSGLGRVAAIRGVQVLNINDLSAALRPTLTAGSTVGLVLVRPGEQVGQAVGFLEDGTMVVVTQAAEYIGQAVTVEVTSQLQTSAGRLIFARIAPDPEGGADEDGAMDDDAGEQAPGPDAGPQAAGDTAPQSGAPEQAEGGTSPDAGPRPLGGPLSVKPPVTPPPAKTPFPPNRAPRNPQRNPRR